MPASTFAPRQNTTASTSAPDDLLDHFLLIQHKAYDELKKECRRLASEQGRKLWTLYPQAALSRMSEELPKTKEEMLKLPYVTKANYEKYGRHLLPITNKYYRERQHIKMNFQDKEMPHSCSEPPSKRPRCGS